MASINYETRLSLNVIILLMLENDPYLLIPNYVVNKAENRFNLYHADQGYILV